MPDIILNVLARSVQFFSFPDYVIGRGVLLPCAYPAIFGGFRGEMSLIGIVLLALQFMSLRFNYRKSINKYLGLHLELV